VLRKSPCPVLAVKEALDGNDFRKVAFASDFEPKSKVAFEKIKPLIKLFKSAVHLLFVNIPAHFTSTQEVTSKMNLLKHGNEEISFHQHIFNDSEVEKGIIAFAETQNIKWVILVSSNLKNAPSYQVGTTETLIFKSDLGVLSVKS
jgi:hypothetical protein